MSKIIIADSIEKNDFYKNTTYKNIKAVRKNNFFNRTLCKIFFKRSKIFIKEVL